MELSICAGKGEHQILFNILFNGDHARVNISLDREIQSETNEYRPNKRKVFCVGHSCEVSIGALVEEM